MEMHEVVKSFEELSVKLAEMRGILHIDDKFKEIQKLSQVMNAPDFWSDPQHATKKSKELS